MARTAKPQKLETYQHKSLGVSVDLCFAKSTADFCFDLAGRTYRANSLDALRTLAHREIEATHNVEWISVIEIERLEPFARHDKENFIGFDLDRFWIAKKHVGGWIKHDWEDNEYENRHLKQDEDRTHWIKYANWFSDANFTFHKLTASYRGEKKYYIPYSAIVWDNLLFVQNQIRTLSGRLDALMTTEDGLAKLEAPGFKLLGAGQ